MIKRTKAFVQVSLFLSKYGKNNPPASLATESWKEAYHIFFESLNEGRPVSTLEHSLKASRDTFDGYFPETDREGWKEKTGEPKILAGLNKEVYKEFKDKTEQEMWQVVSQYANLLSKEYESEFDNLIALEESEKPETKAMTEGGTKVVISYKIERNPLLRGQALKIHGCKCMACGFSFEEKYGVWGKDWAEVHHLVPLANYKAEKRVTDPSNDLAVVCANCHRMIHRKKGIVLTLEELKKKMV